jgi:hypothetical protein
LKRLKQWETFQRLNTTSLISGTQRLHIALQRPRLTCAALAVRGHDGAAPINLGFKNEVTSSPGGTLFSSSAVKDERRDDATI